MRLGPPSASTRINLRFPVDAWMVDAHGMRLRVCDVSLGGALLATESEHQLGEGGPLTLHLEGQRVPVCARVAWRQLDSETGLCTYGVEFTDMSRQVSRALREVVRGAHSRSTTSARWRAMAIDSSRPRLLVTISRLELAGFAVWPARTPLAAVNALVCAPPFDAVVVGRQVSTIDGNAFLDFVASEWPATRCVRIAWAEPPQDSRAGACLARPWDWAALRAAAMPA